MSRQTIRTGRAAWHGAARGAAGGLRARVRHAGGGRTPVAVAAPDGLTVLPEPEVEVVVEGHTACRPRDALHWTAKLATKLAGAGGDEPVGRRRGTPTTTAGLPVTARRARTASPTGVEGTDAALAALALTRHATNPQWHDTLAPRPTPPDGYVIPAKPLRPAPSG